MLPIDASRGFPQSFPMLFGGRTYDFELYVNVPARRIQRSTGAYVGHATLRQPLGEKDATAIVDSIADFPGETPFFVTVGAETLQITGIAGTTLKLTRGANGSKAAGHDAGSAVTYVTTLLDLPYPEAHLIVRVDLENPDATREAIFSRKVITGQEYEAGDIALTFSSQVVAVGNLNGQGDLGSMIIGGIASRWA